MHFLRPSWPAVCIGIQKCIEKISTNGLPQQSNLGLKVKLGFYNKLTKGAEVKVRQWNWSLIKESLWQMCWVGIGLSIGAMTLNSWVDTRAVVVTKTLMIERGPTSMQWYWIEPLFKFCWLCHVMHEDLAKIDRWWKYAYCYHFYVGERKFQSEKENIS